MKSLIEQLYREGTLPPGDLYTLLSKCTADDLAFINEKAREVTFRHFGNRIFIRGLIEVGNCCHNDCLYCGIRRSNRNIERYRLSQETILACCREGYELGFRTFVLQGGEDTWLTDERAESLISAIWNSWPDTAITLSLGEQERRYFYALMLRSRGKKSLDLSGLQNAKQRKQGKDTLPLKIRVLLRNKSKAKE